MSNETYHTTRAVIFGDSSNAYDMYISLVSFGVPVTIYSEKISGTSYCCPQSVMKTCPSPHKTDLFFNFLNRNYSDKKVVLIPAGDSYSVALSSLRDCLGDNFLFLSSPPLLSQNCVNKIAFSELCKDISLDAPFTTRFKQGDKIDYSSLRYPGILKKPDPEAIPADVLPKVIRVNNAEECKDIVSRVTSAGYELVFQEEIWSTANKYFIGGIYTENSKPAIIFCGKKLLESPLLGGTTTLAELKWNQEVVDLANQFVAKTKFKGLIDIEFKFDDREEKYKIIEVNPRIGQWHSIGKTDTCNIIYYYYLMMCNKVTYCASYCPQENGRIWIYPYLHLCSCIENRGLFYGVLHWVYDLKTASVSCDWNSKNRMKTFLQIRTVIGHVRRLGLKVLIFGSNE